MEDADRGLRGRGEISDPREERTGGIARHLPPGAGIQTMRVEAPEGRSLLAILAPQLRHALLCLSRNEQARELARRALREAVGAAA